MRIDKARLRDTPALAWIAAQAFAAESTQTGVRRRARGLYLMHLYSLALLTCGGRLWHWEKKAIIAIEHKKPQVRWKWIAPTGLYSVVVIGVLVLIYTADSRGLQIFLAVMKAGWALMIIIIVLLLPAVIPALRELHPQRSARNADAIRQWRRLLPRQEAYKVSYLAMYPQTREGLVFARAAIGQVVPASAPLYTEVRSESHKVIYARRGFHQLATAGGMPTMAMGTR